MSTQTEVKFQVVFACPKQAHLEIIAEPEVLFAQDIQDAQKKVESLDNYHQYGLFQILDSRGMVLKMDVSK